MDECRALGAPSECCVDIGRGIVRSAIEALHADGIRTEAQLRAALKEASDGELEALLALVEREMPNPFVWTPPTEPFCSHCDKRPDWWAAATIQEREAKGYKRVLVDFENQEVELRYCGRTVVCDSCQAESDEQSDEYEKVIGFVDHGPDPYTDDKEYERYCIEMQITACLGNEDWADEPS